MRVSRDRFVGQFSCSILVHSLSLWSRSTKRFPEHIPGSIYDTMRMCAGEIPISRDEFRRIVEPAIRELHQRTPFRQRPDHTALTGLVYDALDAAGVEIEIGPAVRSHGGAFGANHY